MQNAYGKCSLFSTSVIARGIDRRIGLDCWNGKCKILLNNYSTTTVNEITNDSHLTENKSKPHQSLRPPPNFYREINDEQRKYHGLMPLKRYDDDEEDLLDLLQIEVSPWERRQIQFKKSKIYIQSIIESLKSMRTAAISSYKSSIPSGVREGEGAPRGMTTPVELILRRKYTSQPLPKFPPRWTKEGLVNYLKELTEFHHTKSKYSSPTGLIPAIVKDLLRVNNSNTMIHFSTEAFNIGIAYHIRNKDLRSARQLFYDMQASGISVNTETFNILLMASRYMMSNPKDIWRIHPLLAVSRMLNKMQSKGIPSNWDTWNIVLSSIPEGSNKSLLLQEMSRRNIPLSHRGLAVCVSDIVDQAGPKLVMLYLDRQAENYEIGIDSINTIIDGLLKDNGSYKKTDEISESQNNNGSDVKEITTVGMSDGSTQTKDNNTSRIGSNRNEDKRNEDTRNDSLNDKTSKIQTSHNLDVAWKYLQYAVNKWELQPTTSTLNTFGQYFARHGEINWFIGLYSAMNSQWGTKASCVTYELLLEAAVRSPFHPHKFEIIEMLYSVSSRMIRTKRAQNWILRAKTQFDYYRSVKLDSNIQSEKLISKDTFCLSKKQTYDSWKLWQEALNILKWEDGEPKLVYKDIDEKSDVAIKLNLFPKSDGGNYNAAYHHRDRKKFYSEVTRKFRLEQAKEEELKRQKLLERGPYQTFVEDLAEEGLIGQ